jgi:hypothetical protein
MNPEQPIDESFATLHTVQEGLEQLGYYFYPVAKEHTEAGITDPLVHRIRTQVKKRGFEKLAGKVAVAFSGYAHDEREIFAVLEVRAYWRKLDRELPELPALLAYLPQIGFNGPGIHLMMVGTVEEAVHHPEIGGYDVSITGAPTIVDDAVRRIRQASVTHRLRLRTTQHLIDQFLAGATHQIQRS